MRTHLFLDLVIPTK